MSKLSYPYRLVSKAFVPFVPRCIKPNHIVLLGLLLFILFPIFFFNAHQAIAAVVLVIVVWLDHLDGDLARSRNEVSAWGGLIDMLSDRLRGLLLSLFIGYDLMVNSYYVFTFVPFLLYVLNEFFVPIIRNDIQINQPIAKLIFNIDFLGWVLFSYVFLFYSFLNKDIVVIFYVTNGLFVFARLVISLYLRYRIYDTDIK